jgi:uncharacterized protein YmfQ (DUF2313 family)
MAVMNKSFKTLFPKGEPWKFPTYFKAVRDAISLSLDRAHDFIMDVIAESNPGTATDMISEWFDMLNIKYDSTQSLANLRKRASQIYSSVGGQTRSYIEQQIQLLYPDVEVKEYVVYFDGMAGLGMAGLMMASSYPSWLTSPPTDGSYPVYYYRVVGEVDDVSDLHNVYNLLDRIAPLTHEPVFSVTIRNQTATGEAGLAMAGLAQAGRTKEDA